MLGPVRLVATPRSAIGSSSAAITSLPDLESVHFGDDPPMCSLATPPDSGRNITFFRGSRIALPIEVLAAASSPVKEVANNFASACCKAPPPAFLCASPPRRRAKSPVLQMSIRRSERLAKKSRQRATKPALQAQNVMKKKLGLTTVECPPDASAFQCYTDTFSSVLSHSQCEALDTLLPAGALLAGASVPESLV